MLITLFNIEKADMLFDAVDQCAEPVVIAADNGRREDIRNNPFIRKLLVEAGLRGCISQLKLHVEATDFSIIHRFMLES